MKMTKILTKKIQILLLLLIIIGLAGTTYAEQKSSLNRITGAELTTMMKSGEKIVIVDVREPWLYRKGHIPGAINIQYQDNSQTRILNELSRKETIVFVCHGGPMGDELGNILIKNHYPNVYNLKGGMHGWYGELER